MKNDRVYVRINEDIKEDFEAVAVYRGLTTSALLHSLIVKTVHEMREEKPQIFKQRISPSETKTEAEKISAKSPSKKNSDPATFRTRDGKTLPLMDEAASADDEDL